MTWIGEVAHVAWKDVRQQRWLLVAYVALVALATIRAALYATIGNASSVFSATMPLVVLLGCIVGAVVVQGDSPTRADAFWLSRPFRASAMLATKLLVVAIVIALPLLGEAIGLAAFDVPRRDMPLLLLACLTSFGMWLMISVLIGSLTSDLRSFVVAFIGLLIAIGLLTGYLLSTRNMGIASTRSTFVTIGIATVVLGVLTLVLLYKRWSWRWLAWMTTGVTSAGALLTIFAGPFATATNGTPISVGPLEASVAEPRSFVGEREQLTFNITAPQAPDSLTSGFLLENVTAELVDGSTLNLREVPPYTVRLHTADIPVRSVSWLRHNFAAPITASVHLTREEQQALSRGVRDYVLTGQVLTQQPVVLGAIPLRIGSQLNSNGSQTRITSLDRMPRDVKLDVKSLGIDAPEYRSSSFLMNNERFTFALVNARAGQGLVLVQTGAGMGSDWLLLPGTAVSQSSFQLRSGIRSTPGEQVVDLPDEWYRDASLVVARWETVGSYTTTIRTAGANVRE
jgi:hypothetical protein